MSNSSFLNRRHGATLAGIFSLALGGVLLLCGAGSVPVENFAPQGAMQSDLNAGGHSLTNAATVSATNMVVSGTLTAPSTFNLAFSQVTGTPTTLGGYGITDPIVLTSGSYTNPSWLTSIAYSKLTGSPTIPAAQVNSDWTAASGLAQILNKPALGSLSSVSPTGTATSTTFLKYDGTTFSYAVPPGFTTSGAALLYGNGAGGVSNATVGSGLSFSSGTLAASVVSVAGRTGTITLGAADISGAIAATNNGSDFSSALTTAQNLGVSFSKVTPESASFTVAATDRGTLFNVTTGTASLAVTLPTAANGMFFAVRKADSSTGNVTINGKLMGTSGQLVEVFCDGTSFYNKFSGGTVDPSGNFSFTEPANGNYNILTSGTGSFQLNGSSLTLGGNFTTTGAFPVTESFTGTTTLTFPTSGTLLTTTGSGASLTSIPTSVSNADGSLTVSPTTGSVVASLNYAHTGTWTSPQVIAANGAASTSVFSMTGTPGVGTGTTSLPMLYLNSGTGTPTTWSTSGTDFGINAASGFAGNFMDLRVNGGSTQFSISSGGAIFANGSVQCGPITTTNASTITFQARTKLFSFADGNFTLENNAGTSFGLLQLGGTTSSFPALKRSSAGVIVRLADDSADSTVEASTFNSAAAQTTVSGSTSGSIVCSEPMAGASFKMVSIHVNNLTGTATYTFPIGFTNIPHESDGLGLATSINSSAVTITGSSTTGDIILIGY